MKPLETVTTARLILRKPRTDDAPAIFANYAQDPEVTRYMIWRPHKRVEETYHVLERILNLWDEDSDYSYVITLKGATAAVGMLALHPEGYKVGLGYVLARPLWGKGYITEAALAMTNWLLAQFDIYRVFATCDVENIASARVSEKAGMTCEGLLRKYILHPNIRDEPRDSYLYAIVK